VRGEFFPEFLVLYNGSTGHLSEYIPWFRKNREAPETYCDEPSFGGETGAYYNWCRLVSEKYSGHDPLEFESTEIEKRIAAPPGGRGFEFGSGAPGSGGRDGSADQRGLYAE
jgi:hypothetical protein